MAAETDPMDATCVGALARVRAQVTALAVTSLVVTGCGNDNENNAFILRQSDYVAVRGGATSVFGDLGIFLADESQQAGGTDLNLDGDTTDQVAVAVRFDALQEFCLAAAPVEVAVIGSSVLLVVEEAGNVDWNLNGIDERVILRWNVGDDLPEFAAVADPSSPRSVVAAGGRAWYVIDEDPAGPNQTNLRYAESTSPNTEFEVLTDGATLGEGRYQLLGSAGPLGLSDSFVLVGVDETDPFSQGDANGDSDDSDTAVLALIEASAPDPLLIGTGLAMPGPDAPVDAGFRGGTRYEFAVLVDETDQAGTNLNADFTPAICGGGVDTDIDDAVLHLLVFEDGVVQQVSNTRIAGEQRVFAVDGFVGAVSAETSIGPAGCDLTNDGFVDDFVLRFAPTDLPGSPVDLDSLYLPLATALAGDSNGAVGVGKRFVAAIDPEFVVPGGVPGTPTLAQIDPLVNVEWSFEHLDPDPQFPPLVIALSWMGREAVGVRVPIVLPEETLGSNLNRNCGLDVKDSGTPDVLDPIPGVLRVQSTGAAIVSGNGWAVSPTGPQVLAFGQTFLRVDEAADGFDWNSDGDQSDAILFRISLSGCNPVEVAEIDDSAFPPIETDGGRGAMLYTDETTSGVDLNGDGNVGGLALRYFSAF